MIGVSKIVEYSKVNREDAHCRTSYCECRYDPMYRGKRCPSEPEQSNRHEDALHTAEVESALRGRHCFAVMFRHSFLIHTNQGREQSANAHGCKDR